MTGCTGYGGRAAFQIDEFDSALNHSDTLLWVRREINTDLPRRKVTVRKIVVMFEQEWSRQREPWERVRWARLYWQSATGQPQSARAAAESLGMQENTYSAYERGPGSSKSTALDLQRAQQFGKKFKVSWVWLVSGEGSPFDQGATLSPEAREAAEAVDRLPDERRKLAAEAIKALLTGT